MLVSTLKKIGLTDKESKLYLTSLRIGPSSMQTLARTAGIDRGTAYHVAHTLTEKGLFTIQNDSKRPLFTVTPPSNLYNYVETQKKEADQHFDAMQEMIDDLEELYSISVS